MSNDNPQTTIPIFDGTEIRAAKDNKKAVTIMFPSGKEVFLLPGASITAGGENIDMIKIKGEAGDTITFGEFQ